MNETGDLRQPRTVHKLKLSINTSTIQIMILLAKNIFLIFSKLLVKIALRYHSCGENKVNLLSLINIC